MFVIFTGTWASVLSHAVSLSGLLIPLIHNDGIRQVTEWSTDCTYYNKKNKQINLLLWMMELKKKAVGTSPEWRPNAFIIS
jgi:hypothetical protein